MHSPSRSESDVFRAVVLVTLGVAVAIVVGVLSEPLVGDEDPVQGARDGLGGFAADEVIVCTHPRSRSRWLERGVVEHLGASSLCR